MTETAADYAADDKPARPARTWAHPTGNNHPKSVLIVALGPSKTALLELTTRHVPPDSVMSVDEVWGINGGVNHFAGRVAYDLLWVLDHLGGEQRKEPKYANLISAWAERHQRPVMTTQRTGDFEGCSWLHELPLEDMLREYGPENAYFHNSLPYMIVYALWIGVERLVIFGADYSHEAIKRREDDRANAEYWIGYARAKGMIIQVPDSTTLLNTSHGVWFYGFRDQPLQLVREVV